VAHEVAGFELRFTSRTSWKAERRLRGAPVDVIPITWTKGWRPDPVTKDIKLEVWFQDHREMDRRRLSSEPFAVALAVAKSYEELPHSFSEFRGVFEVVATGKRLSDNSIETNVLRRLKAD
jgi:hypothetical protein